MSPRELPEQGLVYSVRRAIDQFGLVFMTGIPSQALLGHRACSQPVALAAIFGRPAEYASLHSLWSQPITRIRSHIHHPSLDQPLFARAY